MSQTIRESDLVNPADSPADCPTCRRWREVLFNGGEKVCAGCALPIESCNCEPLAEAQ
jgi:hypothetical protein